MLEQDMLLRTTPISEVVMSQMDQQYVSRVTWYLEQVLHCRVTYRGRQGGYHIQLPAGTIEAIYVGQSTQWTRRTIICFPGGQKLTKYILTPFNPSHPTCTMLAFPNDVLEGPEPPITQRPV
jgi:hypothetical protein